MCLMAIECPDVVRLKPASAMNAKDPLTRAERSELMAKVRSSGNRSTELEATSALRRHGISGWVAQPRDVLGKPDIFFPHLRLCVFLDGCFWHGCPQCGRIPKTRVDFWTAKIAANKRRDRFVSRNLRQSGYSVMRVWEHALKNETWIGRLRRMVRRRADCVSATSE